MLFSLGIIKLLILGSLVMCGLGVTALLVLLILDWKSGRLW